MSKKGKRASRELERLQALYRQQSDVAAEPAAPVPPTAPAGGSNPIISTTAVANRHAIVKRDLIFLVILIVAMLALLFGLNYLAEVTRLGDVIVGMFGGIF